MAAVDLTARRFGRWTVLRRGDAPRTWVCVCDCGTERPVHSSNLLGGGSTQCRSCLRSRGNLRHGGCGTPEYRAWAAMVTRCTNPKQAGWPNYGGRGISIHPEWRVSFAAFLRDVGPKPGPEYSIDRIDNDGNYEPGNVRWATRTQQNNNQRRRKDARS